MAFENVRPFYLDTSGMANALEGLFAGIKKKKEDAGYGELLNSLTGGGGPAPAYGNALAAPAIEPMQQPGNPPVLQAGYGRESGPGAAPQNALSPNLVSSIKGFEGYAPRAQWDYKQHSVGYGTRANYPGEVIDKPEAERRLNTEIGKAKGIVDQFAPNAPQGVKDALTSLTYNSGDEWTRSGLGAAIKRGDYTDAQRRFVQYNRAGGQVNKGLVNRRNQEAQWFNGGSGGQSAQPAQPPQVADASGGGDQARMLAWARANPGHPAAKAIASTMVEQRMDPTAGIKLQQAQIDLQNAQQGQQLEAVKRSAMRAQAVLQMPPGPARDMAWKQTLTQHMAEHPSDEITPEEADPTTGPQLMMAQAGAFLDTQKQDLERRGLKADIAKKEAEASLFNAKAAGTGSVYEPKQKADVEEGMRKEITSQSKAYADVRDAYARVKQSSAVPSPAGDLALIFNYMKMLDPGSVVREAEFATAAQAGSFGDVIQGLVSKVVNGQRLAPNMRSDFVFQAEGLMKKQEEQFKKVQGQYEGIAKRSNVDPKNVLIDLTSPDSETADAPRLQFPLVDKLPSGEYVWNPATGKPERK